MIDNIIYCDLSSVVKNCPVKDCKENTTAAGTQEHKYEGFFKWPPFSLILATYCLCITQLLVESLYNTSCPLILCHVCSQTKAQTKAQTKPLPGTDDVSTLSERSPKHCTLPIFLRRISTNSYTKANYRSHSALQEISWSIHRQLPRNLL